MKLYEKTITPDGRVKYVEHVEPDRNIHTELQQEQAVTLLASLAISMLMSVAGQLPAHSAVARRVTAVEEAIRKLAQLNPAGLDGELIEIGVNSWNAAIMSMQAQLQEQA